LADEEEERPLPAPSDVLTSLYVTDDHISEAQEAINVREEASYLSDFCEAKSWKKVTVVIAGDTRRQIRDVQIQMWNLREDWETIPARLQVVQGPREGVRRQRHQGLELAVAQAEGVTLPVQRLNPRWV
jgi:hypothetical protein